MHPMASAFWTACHGICLRYKECQGNNLLDVMHVFQMQLSRHNASRCSCQLTTCPDTAATAYTFWTKSVLAIVLRMQYVSSG